MTFSLFCVSCACHILGLASLRDRYCRKRLSFNVSNFSCCRKVSWFLNVFDCASHDGVLGYLVLPRTIFTVNVLLSDIAFESRVS